MALIFSNYEAGNVAVYFEYPTIAVLSSTFVKPGIKLWIVSSQAIKDGAVLINFVCLALYHIRKNNMFCRE